MTGYVKLAVVAVLVGGAAILVYRVAGKRV